MNTVSVWWRNRWLTSHATSPKEMGGRIAHLDLDLNLPQNSCVLLLSNESVITCAKPVGSQLNCCGSISIGRRDGWNCYTSKRLLRNQRRNFYNRKITKRLIQVVLECCLTARWPLHIIWLTIHFQLTKNMDEIFWFSVKKEILSLIKK